MPFHLLAQLDGAHRLDRPAAEVAAGAGRAVLIEGEPGIGKAALPASVESHAERLGMRVLSGTAEEIEQQLPFAAISCCLGVQASSDDARSAGVTALMRGEGWIRAPLAAEATDAALAEAFLARVDELCADGPLALVLDDLHWRTRPASWSWAS
jgi:predicted ATPase